MYSGFTTLLLLLSTILPSVHGHGLITAVTGANGVTGTGFGVDASTPRDGSGRKPFQQDTSVIRDREIASGKTQACGRTDVGGVNDIAAQLSAADSAGLPTAASDGSITMTVHQVNQDGAGPYSCDVSADGTGKSFVKMSITKNVPGVFSLSTATAQDFQLVAQMPAGTTCTGGPSGAACLVRCRNNAVAGPFGSCVAVANAGAVGGAPAGSNTAAAPAAGSKASTGNGAGKGGGIAQAIKAVAGQDKRAKFEHKRWLKSRVVGRRGAFRWI